MRCCPVGTAFIGLEIENEMTTAHAINIGDVDHSAERLLSRLSRVRTEAACSHNRVLSSIFFWAVAKRSEFASLRVRDKLEELKHQLERDLNAETPYGPVDPSFRLSDRIARLGQLLDESSDSLDALYTILPRSAKRTMASIEHSRKLLAKSSSLVNDINWEIGTNDAAFLRRSDDVSASTNREIQEILSKIAANV